MAGRCYLPTYLLTVAVATLLSVPGPTPACEFCGMQGQTLTSQVTQASMVLYGTFSPGKPDDDFTRMNIETVVKKHDALGDNDKAVTLARYIPTDKDNKYKFMVFCDVYKGKIDPSHLIAFKTDSDVAKYLKGALDIAKEKDVSVRLGFFFQYLDNADLEIANDSYKEFGNADYKDVREAAKTMLPDKIAGWLKDPNTPAFRHGLYALLLGHCGKAEHGKVLRDILADPKKRLGTGVDGMLVGYTLLQPKEGWKFTQELMKDSDKEFALRYAALRAARWFHNVRTDVIDKKDVVAGVAALLDQDDIADLAIEDLRRWGCWELTDCILDLYGKKSHDIPIIRRNILRYALQSPEKRAAEFVADMRKKDAKTVELAEELLKLDPTPPMTKK
jgi:hypothetical protein